MHELKFRGHLLIKNCTNFVFGNDKPALVLYFMFLSQARPQKYIVYEISLRLRKIIKENVLGVYQ